MKKYTIRPEARGVQLETRTKLLESLLPWLIGAYLALVLLFSGMQFLWPDLFGTGLFRRLTFFVGLIAGLASLFVARRCVSWSLSIFAVPIILSLILICGAVPVVFGSGTLRGIQDYAMLVLFSLMGLTAIRDMSSLWRTLLLYVVACGISSLFAFYLLGSISISQTNEYISIEQGRITGTISDQNVFGLSIALVLPLLFVRIAIVRDKKLVLAFSAIIVIILIAIGLTVSRTTIVATSLSLFVLFSSMRAVSKRNMAIFAVVAVCLVGKFFVEYAYELESTFKTHRDRVRLNSRTAPWKEGLNALQTVGIIGKGCGSELVRTENGIVFKGSTSLWVGGRDFHNTYLRIGVETGWVGFVLFIAVCLLVLCRLIKACRYYHPSTSEAYFVKTILSIVIAGLIGIFFLNISIPLIFILFGATGNLPSGSRLNRQKNLAL